MRFLSLFATVLLLIVTLPSGGNAQQVDCRANPTNPACLKHLQQPGTPTECRDPRWYNIHQSGPGIVTLNIYDERGVQVNANNPQHNGKKEAYDRFCISGHWLNRGYTFEWCTDDAGRAMSRDRMVTYANTNHVIELVPSPNNRPHRPAWLPQGQLR